MCSAAESSPSYHFFIFINIFNAQQAKMCAINNLPVINIIFVVYVYHRCFQFRKIKSDILNFCLFIWRRKKVNCCALRLNDYWNNYLYYLFGTPFIRAPLNCVNARNSREEIVFIANTKNSTILMMLGLVQ